MSTRRAFVLLVVIGIFLSTVTFALGMAKERSDTHEVICEMIEAQLDVPAPKPVGNHPGREQEYLVHQRFMELSTRHRCDTRS
jgi:hypothetical protein